LGYANLHCFPASAVPHSWNNIYAEQRWPRTLCDWVETMKKGDEKKSTNVCHATNTTKRADCCRKADIKPSASIGIISDLVS
jgi:hypothetical protein